MHHITVATRNRTEFKDITIEVRRVVKESGVVDGVCYLYVPHTTAGITVNEAADPSVAEDIQNTLNRLIPPGAGYAHREGNADSHVKAALVGSSQHLLVENSDLVLGTWQGIFFCEFDGPRSRKVSVKVVGNR